MLQWYPIGPSICSLGECTQFFSKKPQDRHHFAKMSDFSQNPVRDLEILLEIWESWESHQTRVMCNISPQWCHFRNIRPVWCLRFPHHSSLMSSAPTSVRCDVVPPATSFQCDVFQTTSFRSDVFQTTSFWSDVATTSFQCDVENKTSFRCDVSQTTSVRCDVATLHQSEMIWKK